MTVKVKMEDDGFVPVGSLATRRFFTGDPGLTLHRYLWPPTTLPVIRDTPKAYVLGTIRLRCEGNITVTERKGIFRWHAVKVVRDSDGAVLFDGGFTPAPAAA